MNKMMKQFRTSTAPKKCIVRHYIDCMFEDLFSKQPKPHITKNRCVWDLENEG